VRKEERQKTDEQSGFKCAWCGVLLTERHHITEYAVGGSNTADNLILLCPNCHTEVHNGTISKGELESRKKELSGIVDRSTGCLNIQGDPVFVAGGTRYLGIERIVVHNEVDYLKIERANGVFQISMRLFDAKGCLICWMSRNRWWLEIPAIFDFQMTRDLFEVHCELVGCVVSVKIEGELVKLRARMYIEGTIVEFNETKSNIRNAFGGSLNLQIGTIRGSKESIAFLVQ
jgi:hypothetical protein